MTDRASAEGLRAGDPLTDDEVASVYAAYEKVMGDEAITPLGRRQIIEPLYEAFIAVRNVRILAALRDTGPRPRLDSEGTADIEGVHHDDAADIFTGPRPDSDPWPDLDGPWRDDQGYWLGGMGTPDTGPRPDSGIDLRVGLDGIERVRDHLVRTIAAVLPSVDDEGNEASDVAEGIADSVIGTLRALSTPRITDRASAEGLRETLQTYAPLVKRDGYLNVDALIGVLRPYLRDTGPRPDSGIDVERLARAMGGCCTAAGTVEHAQHVIARLSTRRTETSEP